MSDASGPTTDTGSSIEVWRKLDGQPLPVALQRIVDEMKADDAAGVPMRYDRVYSRHNRS